MNKEDKKREAIADFITGFGCGILPCFEGCGTCEGLAEEDKCSGALDVADQILALIGEEAIRKDERERMLNLFYNKLSEEYQGSRNTPANVNLLSELFDFVKSQKEKGGIK